MPTVASLILTEDAVDDDSAPEDAALKKYSGQRATVEAGKTLRTEGADGEEAEDEEAVFTCEKKVATIPVEVFTAHHCGKSAKFFRKGESLRMTAPE